MFDLQYEQIIKKVSLLLNDNTEWIQRYSGYAEYLVTDTKNQDLGEIKPRIGDIFPKNHYEINKYSSVSRVNSKRFLDLRYKGLNFIQLEKDKNIYYAFLWNDSTKKYSDKIFWNKENIQIIREKAEQKLSLIDNIKSFHEYAVESSLKAEMQSSPKKETFKGFRTIRIPRNKKAPYEFQMPTPLRASNAKKDEVGYSGSGGGGIDLLARSNRFTKKSDETSLCVIEIKDSYEKSELPIDAIKQAIAYATFIRYLLRTKEANNEIWYSLFRGNITKKYPEKMEKPIEIRAIIAMPFGDDIYKPQFVGQEYIFLDEYPEDKITLDYMNLVLDNYNVSSIKNYE